MRWVWVSEARKDLAAQRHRSVLLALILTGICWLPLALHRQVAVSTQRLADLTTSAQAGLVRITAPSQASGATPPLASAAAQLVGVDGTLLVEPLGIAPFHAGGAQFPVLAVRGDLTPTIWNVPCGLAQTSPVTAGSQGLSEAVGHLRVGERSITVANVATLPPILSRLNGSVLLRSCTLDAGSDLYVAVHDPTRVADTTAIVVSSYPAGARSTLVVTSAQSRISQAAAVLVAARSDAVRVTTASAVATAILVALVFWAQVVQRRQDLGRRRALGATATFVLVLVVSQATTLVGIALMSATAVEMLIRAVTGTPQPPASLTSGHLLMVFAGAIAGSLVPAAIAARADPVREIRIP